MQPVQGAQPVQPAQEGQAPAPAGDATVVVPSTAAPNTLAPKSTGQGASLPVAPDAANPRANAQPSTGGQAPTPAAPAQTPVPRN